jgi:hypothetical protein
MQECNPPRNIGVTPSDTDPQTGFISRELRESSFDDQTFAQLSVDARLQRAREPGSCEKAICNN